MGNAEKLGGKIKKWSDANLLSSNFYVLPTLPAHLSVFSKFCIMNTLLLCPSYRSLRNVSFGGRIPRLIKSAYHGRVNMMTSSEGPHFNLASPPSNLKPTTELTLLNSSNVIKRSLSESHSCMVRSAMCDNCSLLMFEPTSNSST